MNTTRLDPTRPARIWQDCPLYAATPLTQADINGRPVLIKDETDRMGLGAFKALGGIYAVARLIEEHIGRPLDPAELRGDITPPAADLTFLCASAGNHGLAVATGARMFGARARILLSDTVDEGFAHRLRDRGAEVVRAGATYEDSVAAAIADAEATGAIHLADGSWPGYTEPPRLVMEGYTVMAEEMRRELEQRGAWPSHVYLQAGVGGLAAGIAQMIRRNWAQQPQIIVVEPEAAPCLQASVAAGDITTVEGPVSGMGRLDCKTPSMLAFEILRAAADQFVTVSEAEAEAAVTAADAVGVHSTPSGSAGLAAALRDRAERPLVILSEGRA